MLLDLPMLFATGIEMTRRWKTTKGMTTLNLGHPVNTKKKTVLTLNSDWIEFLEVLQHLTMVV